MFLSFTSIGIKPKADIRAPDAASPPLYALDVLLKQISYDTAFFYLHPRYVYTNCDEQTTALYRHLTELSLNFIEANSR
jgi:hypothetical protein